MDTLNTLPTTLSKNPRLVRGFLLDVFDCQVESLNPFV